MTQGFYRAVAFASLAKTRQRLKAETSLRNKLAAQISPMLSFLTENAAQIKFMHYSQVLAFNLRPRMSANLGWELTTVIKSDYKMVDIPMTHDSDPRDLTI